MLKTFIRALMSRNRIYEPALNSTKMKIFSHKRLSVIEKGFSRNFLQDVLVNYILNCILFI